MATEQHRRDRPVSDQNVSGHDGTDFTAALRPDLGVLMDNLPACASASDCCSPACVVRSNKPRLQSSVWCLIWSCASLTRAWAAFITSAAGEHGYRIVTLVASTIVIAIFFSITVLTIITISSQTTSSSSSIQQRDSDNNNNSSGNSTSTNTNTMLMIVITTTISLLLPLASTSSSSSCR